MQSAGLRVTAPRLAVLAHLLSHRAPMSHSELWTALRGKGGDRATVYRVLVDLAGAGILSRSDLGDHVWRFEVARNLGDDRHEAAHPHFVCLQCGAVSCLTGTSIALRTRSRVPKSVAKSEVSVQLRGLCDACA